MISCFRNNKEKTKEEGFFLKNGAAVLEQVILLFNGKCNSLRSFSAKDIKKATDNFNSSRLLYKGCGYRMYKGVHEDREISVKKFELTSYLYVDNLEFTANEVPVASQMSNHRNVLKLLGCCLETELPVLVYEFPEKGNLSCYLDRDGNEQLPLEIKLKILIGIANAVAYLHHGLPKTFIHRLIHSRHVFLDQDYGAKLSEFRPSIPIPEGETHVDSYILGTELFCPPEVGMYGRYTEKSDVYDFGILLCELLTGKRSNLLISGLESFEKGSSDSKTESEYGWDDLTDLWNRHLEANFLQEENRTQKMECAKLAQSCLKKIPDDRPNMIEVAKALLLVKTIQS